MSILNLGLQSVRLAMRQVDDDIEEELKKCNSISHIRELAKKTPSIKGSVQDSVSSKGYSG